MKKLCCTSCDINRTHFIELSSIILCNRSTLGWIVYFPVNVFFSQNKSKTINQKITAYLINDGILTSFRAFVSSLGIKNNYWKLKCNCLSIKFMCGAVIYFGPEDDTITTSCQIVKMRLKFGSPVYKTEELTYIFYYYHLCICLLGSISDSIYSTPFIYGPNWRR